MAAEKGICFRYVKGTCKLGDSCKFKRESFYKATAGLSKRRGVYQMRESRIKELKGAKDE